MVVTKYGAKKEGEKSVVKREANVSEKSEGKEGQAPIEH